MKLSSVRLSVCLSHHSAAARRYGGLAAVGLWRAPGGQEISIDSGGRRAPSNTALSSKCEQCHVVG